MSPYTLSSAAGSEFRKILSKQEVEATGVSPAQGAGRGASDSASRVRSHRSTVPEKAGAAVTQKSTAFVYWDHVPGCLYPGASKTTTAAALAMLRRMLPSPMKIDTISPTEIRDGGRLHDEGNLLCIPGGQDIPYSFELSGEGNRQIRKFVENGGRFLGICAGAYFASGEIDFSGSNGAEPFPGQGDVPHIKGKREISRCFRAERSAASIFPACNGMGQTLWTWPPLSL